MAGWDKGKAVAHLDASAGKVSHSQCAKFTRNAIDAGGLKVPHTLHAKDYGSKLKAVGFVEQATVPTEFQAGDVAVIQSIPGHPDGHMAMYDGTQWVSDFKQEHGMYPGQAYRTQKPSFKIYRYPSQ